MKINTSVIILFTLIKEEIKIKNCTKTSGTFIKAEAEPKRLRLIRDRRRKRRMEVELEPRVKALPFKVKAMSRESPSQKALHVLDTDLRNHWSTATNTKEWILLELNVRPSP